MAFAIAFTILLYINIIPLKFTIIKLPILLFTIYYKYLESLRSVFADFYLINYYITLSLYL